MKYKCFGMLGEERLNCCAIHEIFGIQDEGYSVNSDVVGDFLYEGQDKTVVIFSAVVRDRHRCYEAMYHRGDYLTRLIRKNRLGTVSVKRVRNLNSGNDVKIYTWVPNQTRLRRFIDKNVDTRFWEE